MATTWKVLAELLITMMANIASRVASVQTVMRRYNKWDTFWSGVAHGVLARKIPGKKLQRLALQIERSSYGTMPGNQNVSCQHFQTDIRYFNTGSIENPVLGISTVTILHLQETTTDVDAGFDFRLLGHHFYGTIGLPSQNGHVRPKPACSFWSSLKLENVASLLNTGYEISGRRIWCDP